MGKLKDKALQRHDWSVPSWALWLAGFLVLLALSGLVFGAVQHFRVQRWQKIMAAAKGRIAALESRQALARYKGTAGATSRAVDKARGRETKVDGKLSKLPGKLATEKEKINGMTAKQLRDAFKREGF